MRLRLSQTMPGCLLCLLLLAACMGSTTRTPTPTPGRAQSTPPIQATTPAPTATATAITPRSYTEHILLHSAWRPDDLAFDAQGRVLFSDVHNGIIGRLNSGGLVTVLLRDANGPEGIVALANGTLIFAEQYTNRIMMLAPGASTPVALRALPGQPSSASCKDGVDGIAYDPITNSIIVPDSPIGNVYRLSLDGKTLTLLASGIERPVGATVDGRGNVYIADECGGAVWRIVLDGRTTRIGGFGMPDDVEFDPAGNLLLIDLKPSIHALIRVNLATGQRVTLASQGFIEPQGLLVDQHGNIYVSDDYADTIVEFVPS
jgi:streptogramin lyase